MTHPLSVLQKATRADVRSNPFPHIVLKGALPQETCDGLIASYPSIDLLEAEAGANNKRWSYPTPKVIANPAIPDLWRRFVAYHASEGFFREIVDLFQDDICRLYPNRFPTPQSLRDLEVATRKKDAGDSVEVDGNIYLDAQISGNTPVTSASSVRTTHVDEGRKLFSGLFYLRRDEDDSLGGDLTISRFLPRFSTVDDKLRCFDGVYVDDKNVEAVETVRYAKNTLVLFINSIDSLHGVTVRQPTPHPRIFLNLIGELRDPLYDTKRRHALPGIIRRGIAGLFGSASA